MIAILNKTIPYILFLILLFVGANFYQSCNRKEGISPEVQKTLDSVKTANFNLAIQNAQDKQLVIDLKNQNYDYQFQLSNIGPATKERIIEYRNSTPEQKKAIISKQVEQMQKEMTR